MAEWGIIEPKRRTEKGEPQKEMDQAAFALIADTMSAFRSS